MKPAIQPFATLPLLGSLTEGWLYSPQELGRNPGLSPKHRATDWAAPISTEVRAVAKGFAKASYLFRKHEGRAGLLGTSDGVGWGQFVQIFHPEVSVVTVYAHLNEVSSGIPWLDPIESEEGFLPPIFRQDITELLLGASKVHQGEQVGEVGCSGMRGSEEHWKDPAARLLPAKDRPHLHFECYQILPNGRWVPFDPFDLEQSVGAYCKERGYRLGPNHVWLLDEGGQPRAF